MKNPVNKIMLLIWLTLSLFQASHAGAASKKENNDTAIQNAILVYVNEYRQKQGLSPLKMNRHIVIEAKKHSTDMADHSIPFGHQNFMSRIKRLHTQIKHSNAGAENVAYNYKSAQDVVKNWLRSPGHKANIDGNYNLTGIGIARDQKGKIYFTQIFLRTGSGGHNVRAGLLGFLKG